MRDQMRQMRMDNNVQINQWTRTHVRNMDTRIMHLPKKKEGSNKK